MKKIICYTLLILTFSFLSTQSYSQTNNKTQVVFESESFTGFSNKTDVFQLQNEYTNFPQREILLGDTSGILTLPVVVHVIYNGTVGVVTDQQIELGIQYMNEAFGGYGSFATSQETNIRFKLAQFDPLGNPTNGITRTESSLTNVDMTPGSDGYPTDDLPVKDLVRWNPSQYINIWIVNEVFEGTSTSVAGYAYFPSALKNQPERDGIVMESRYFGATAQKTSVLIHETGHYLGLFHTFEGGNKNNNCQTDGDMICDTPPQINNGSYTYYSCQTNNNTSTADPNDASTNNPFRPIAQGGLGDVIDAKSNFMDYSNLGCYTNFTPLQGNRMYDVVSHMREDLLQSPGLHTCITPITAAITWPNSNHAIGTPIQITNNSNGAQTYEWFMNGNSISTLKDFTYNPTIEGKYEIAIVMQNADKYCFKTEKKLFTVTCPISASYTYSSLVTSSNNPLSFTNTSTQANSYVWYVNDVQASVNQDFIFTPTQNGVYKISMEASNSNCSTFAQSQIVTVVDTYLPQTGFPIWPIVPKNTSKISTFDFKTNPVTISTFTKTVSVSSMGNAIPAFNECGDIKFYAIHDGTLDSKKLHLYAVDGTLLTTTNVGGGFNASHGNGEMQMISVPGKSNEWFLIYKEWTSLSNSGSPRPETIYTPTNWIFSKIRYNSQTDYEIVERDVSLIANGNQGTTYTAAAAVSRTVKGDKSKHYLYLMKRVWGVQNIEIHRYIISNQGITFDKSTGTIPWQWSTNAIDATMVSAELSQDEKTLAISTRSYNTNDNQSNDIIIMNCEIFDNSSQSYRAIIVENTSFTENGSTFLAGTKYPNMGKAVAYLEFSPNSAFLFANSGGNTGESFLLQLDMQDIFNEAKSIELRAVRNSVTTDIVYDISSAYNGNLYVAKTKNGAMALYVIPKEVANNYMTNNLQAGSLDFATIADPNISFTDGNGYAELPDQIDGYNYMRSNVIHTQLAIKGLDCNGNCTTKTFTVEVFDSQTNTTIGTFQANNCSTTIEFCADYFTKYSIRESITGTIFQDVIYQGKVNYPANKSEFEFTVETSCGSVCNSIDLTINSIQETCNGDNVDLTITVGNIGKNKLQSPIPLTLYSNTISSATKLTTYIIDSIIEINSSIDIHISIPRQALQSIIAHINDDGTYPTKGNFPVTVYEECDYTNNSKTISLAHPFETLELGSDVALCDGSSHMISAPQGFTSYVWLPDFSTAKTLTVFETGKYTLEAYDMCNKKYSDFIQVTFTSNPIVWQEFEMCESETSVICNATPLGGTYSGTGITGTTFDPEIAGVGTYELTYEKTVNTCTFFKQINVVVHPGIDIIIDQVPSGVLQTNTSTSLQATINPLPLGQYIYKWSPSSKLISDKTLTPTTVDLQTTTQYTLTVTNPTTNCTAQENIEVRVNTPFSNQLNLSKPSVCQGNSVVVEAQTIGGSGQYSYTWIIPSQIKYTQTSDNTIELQDLQATSDITVEITDIGSSPQSTISQTQTITVYANPKIQPISNISICENSPFDISPIVVGGTLPYTHNWTDDNYILHIGQNSDYASILSNEYKGKYTIQYTVTDQNFCTANQLISVEIAENPVVSIFGKNSVCELDSLEYTALSNTTNIYKWEIASDSPIPLNSYWDGQYDTLLVASSQNYATVEWKQSGKDQIILTSKLGMCSTLTILPVTISKKPAVDFSFHPTEKQYFASEQAFRNTDSIFAGKNVEFTNVSFGEHEIVNPNISFYWDYIGDGVFTENSFESNYSYPESGMYHVQLLAVNNATGCKNTISKPLHVIMNSNCELRFPNAFTPGNNENNEFFPVFHDGIIETGYELRVYNRWGALIWSTEDLHETWNGMYQGELVKQDVYVYHCKSLCEDIDPQTKQHKSKIVKGDITVLR